MCVCSRVSDVSTGCSPSATVIVSQLLSVTVEENEAVRLRMAAVGTAVTYQWQRREDSSSVWSTVRGGPDATLMLTAVSFSDRW